LVLLFKSTHHVGGTNCGFLNHKQLSSKSMPMLEAHPYAGGTDATDPYSHFPMFPRFCSNFWLQFDLKLRGLGIMVTVRAKPKKTKQDVSTW